MIPAKPPDGVAAEADTIVAIATPPGRSGRAVVRISGPAVTEVAKRLLSGAPTDRAATAGLLRLRDDREIAVVILRFAPGASYTGEDTLELLLPGNPSLLERVLTATVAVPGVRAAGPGEFTARAYLSGRLSLDQAEGVAATIAAVTNDQLDSARHMLSGRTGDAYRAWAEELTTLLALVEAGIDFTDQEDVVAIGPDLLRRRLRALNRDLQDHLGATRGGELATTLPRVVLVGRPNAGKSTLFNALLGRRRAVANSVAGTTRDVLAEELDLSGHVPGAGQIVLHDLAGFESAATAMDRAAQGAAKLAARSADLVLWCDPSGVFEPLSLEFPAAHPCETIRVRTFGDRAAPSDRSDIAVCALDGWHVVELKQRIAAATATGASVGAATLLLRHRHAIRDAAIAIHGVLNACEHDEHHLAAPELIADGLRTALDAIGELVGRISPDEVLGKVFSSFCVGK